MSGVKVHEVKRLRWWHRRNPWVGHASWTYVWDGGGWIGMHARHEERVYLIQGHHDTRDYGPYRRLPRRLPKSLGPVS